MKDSREDALEKLRAEHEALEEEHKRLQRQKPVDLASHAAHTEKLREHKEKLHAFAQALRTRDGSDD